jgi:hypothetical protein
MDRRGFFSFVIAAPFGATAAIAQPQYAKGGVFKAKTEAFIPIPRGRVPVVINISCPAESVTELRKTRFQVAQSMRRALT